MLDNTDKYLMSLIEAHKTVFPEKGCRWCGGNDFFATVLYGDRLAEAFEDGRYLSMVCRVCGSMDRFAATLLLKRAEDMTDGK